MSNIFLNAIFSLENCSVLSLVIQNHSGLRGYQSLYLNIFAHSSCPDVYSIFKIYVDNPDFSLSITIFH